MTTKNDDVYESVNLGDGINMTPRSTAILDRLNGLLTNDGSGHYKQGSIEPAAFIRANDMSFFEGSVVKYVTRHRHSANGRKDLEKAIHYIKMIIACDYDE